MVSLELEARADLAGAVGRVLRSDRVRGRSRSGGAEHRKVDGGEDLLEGEHGSRVERSCEGVKGTFRSDEMSMTCSGWKISLTKATIDVGQ